MSSITAATSALLTSPSFRGHGHRRGAHATTESASSTSRASSGSSSGIGQLPVGASTSLFSGLVQSFEQAIGAQGTAAQAAVSGASSPSAATPGQGQELQAFQHSLLQALKQDGLSSGGSANIVSSLQTLIQQVGPNGRPTAATETLTSTFQNLVNGINGSAAVSASNQSPNAGLQSFLNSLLQKVQAGGAQSLSATGSNVNTHV
ncbi:MAG: hypothetical protein ABSG30_13220 [Steroidobacteraceae bacterium]